MNSKLSVVSLLSVILLLAVTSSACGAAVGAVGAGDDVVTAPLMIAGPHDELVYNAADDEDADAPGIQLTVRVDVAPDIERVDLVIVDDQWSDVVTEDLAGRRAAFFDVTLIGTDTPVTASADNASEEPDAATGQVKPRLEARAILRAIP